MQIKNPDKEISWDKSKKFLSYIKNEFFCREKCKRGILIKYYFFSQNSMIHIDIYAETEFKSKISEDKLNKKLNFPINNENRDILLHALDYYDKA